MKPIVPYKTAEELGISEQERKALINVIPDLLALEPDKFSMGSFTTCICKSLEKYIPCIIYRRSGALDGLFMPILGDTPCWKHCKNPWLATPTKAAIAVANFLMHGN